MKLCFPVKFARKAPIHSKSAEGWEVILHRHYGDRGGGGKEKSQINFNVCLNEISAYCGFKKCSIISQLNLDLFLRFLKLGPKRANI